MLRFSTIFRRNWMCLEKKRQFLFSVETQPRTSWAKTGCVEKISAHFSEYGPCVTHARKRGLGAWPTTRRFARHTVRLYTRRYLSHPAVSYLPQSRSRLSPRLVARPLGFRFVPQPIRHVEARCGPLFRYPILLRSRGLGV
jgi:hypothetical protein